MDEIIKLEAKKIRKKLEGAKVYGIPVDLDDVDTAIVASYYMAKLENIMARLESVEKRLGITPPPPDTEYSGEGVA